jgi:L-threonylcarbamoyladenylate synthase
VSELSKDAGLVDEAVEAIRAGKPVVLPTDTVYGLCTIAHEPEAVLDMYRLKGRNADQPTALLAADVEALLEGVPELAGWAERIARALLPGPLTLIFPNSARRFPWLSGSRPETIGVRVPELGDEARQIVQRAGAVAATSANLAGGPDPRRLADVPEEIREGAGMLVDGGELPGTPSTVVDLTGREPQILREGAMPASEVLDRLGQLP